MLALGAKDRGIDVPVKTVLPGHCVAAAGQSCQIGIKLKDVVRDFAAANKLTLRIEHSREGTIAKADARVVSHSIAAIRQKSCDLRRIDRDAGVADVGRRLDDVQRHAGSPRGWVFLEILSPA